MGGEEDFIKKYKFDEVVGKKIHLADFSDELAAMSVQLKKDFKKIADSDDLGLKLAYTRAIALIKIAQSQKEDLEIQKEKLFMLELIEISTHTEPSAGFG